jgi:aminotransferase
MEIQLSTKATRFSESVIRGMSVEAARHGALNLAQGMPDFPAPQALKDAACAAIQDNVNQYAITWGDRLLREAIARKYAWHQGCEVILSQPFYENYWPDCVLTGATPKFVGLRAPCWRLDLEELERAFSNKTKAVILCNPSNPTGCVMTRAELEVVADLCEKWNSILITDEIYEHILYDDRTHISAAAIARLADRSIVISGMSKTYAVTGWRIGTILASPQLTKTIRQVHDFVTIGAAAPLQRAGATAYQFGEDYYAHLAADYQRRRDYICDALTQAGLAHTRPEGAYYVMADISSLGYEDDRQAALALVREAKVAGVPGSSFFLNKDDGKNLIRFCFCKRDETLEEASKRLIAFAQSRNRA